jgi:autotransporter-associated beta strand protein
MFLYATASLAASGFWNGTSDAQWINSANWSATPYPSGNDTASFTNNFGPTTLNVAGLASIKTITFDTPSVAAYTLGTGAVNSQTLIMVDGGEFKLTAAAANSQLFNCGVQLGANVTAQNYSFKNDNPAQTLTFNNVLGSAAGGGTAGAKTLTISGAGNTTILGNIQKGGATSLTLTDTSSGTCTLAGTNTLAVLNMNGSGVLTLSGSNTVTVLSMNGGPSSVVDIGATFLDLSSGGGNVLNCTQGGVINGTGKIRMSTTDGIASNGYNYADLNVTAGKTLVINPEITGLGGIETWTGGGTFVFNGINTFAAHICFGAAGSAISVGRIGNIASVDSNLGKGTNINFNATNTKLIYTGIGETSNRKLILNNTPAILDQSGTNGTLTFSASPTLSAGAKTLTLQGSSAGIGEFSGALVNSSGTLSILKVGSGTWIFSATNTYSGATTINGGTLLINSPGSIASPVTVNNTALLGGNGTINGSVTLATGGMLAPAKLGTIDTLSITNALTLNGNTLFFDIDASNVSTDKVAVAAALTVNGTNTVYLSFPSGIATVGTNTLITFGSQNGSGSFVLAPGYANGYLLLDATTLSLVVTNTGIYGLTWKGHESGIWDLVTANWTNGSAAVTYAEGDAVSFDDTASDFTVTSDNPLSPASVVFNNNASNYTVSAAIAGTAALLQLGSGTTTLTGTNTYVGPTTISSGMLKIGGAGQVGNGNYSANILNGGVFEYASSADQYHSGIISGMGSLVASGNGTLTLSGNNTYGGTTTVSGPGTLVLSGTNTYTGETLVNAGGVLKALSANALGTTGVGTTVNNGGTLELAGTITTLAEALTLNGTLSSQTGTNIYGGGVTLVAGASINVGAGSMLSLNAFQANGAYTKEGAGWLKLLVDPNGLGLMTINNGVAELGQAGGATESDIVINSGGTLIGNSGDAINRVNSVTVNAGGTYVLRQSDIINMFSGAGTLTRDIPGAATLTAGDNNGSSIFSGVIENGSGTMSFTKSGTGTQTLSGPNTYTGATTVSAGTLLINGSLAASAVTVANGAILGGNGTINGPVTVSAGGNLAPGGVNSIGTLTLGSSLTLNGNTLFFDISNADTDKVAVASALTVTGVNNVVINGSLPAGDYTLMTFASMAGAGSFSLVGMSNASLDTTTGTSLILHVASGSGGANLKWAGDKSLIWDSVTMNWLNGSTSSLFTSGDAVLFDDAALNYTVNSGGVVSPASVLFNNSVNVYTVNAIIGGTASVSKFGTVNANLLGVNTFTGPITVGQGTLAINTPGQLGSGNYAQDIYINNGATFHYASTANQILSGVMSGSGTFTKSGSSILILTNANTRTGGTTLSGGTLIAKAFPTALGTGGLRLDTAATTIELDGDTGVAFNNNTTVAFASTVKAGRLTSGPGVTHTLGTLSIGAFTLTASQGASVASGTAGLTFGATTLTGAPTFDVGTGTLLTLGALGGSYNFTKNGVGTLYFGTAGSRTAGNSALTAGTLKVGNSMGLGTTGTTNVLSGGVLDLAIDATVTNYITTISGNTTIQSDKATPNSEGITHALGNLTIAAWTLSVTNGPNVRVQSPFGLAFGAVAMTGNAQFDVANNGAGLGTLTLGAVSGNVTLTKKNFGLLKLLGTNVYNGATTINNGKVMGVSYASCSNSSFTVQATTLENANAGLAILCSVTNGQWTCTNLTTSVATLPATALPTLDFLFNVLPSTNVAPLRVLNNVVFGTNPVVNVYLGHLTVPATNYPLMIVGGIAPTNTIPPLNVSGGYTNSTLFWTNNTLTLKLVGTSLPMKWNPGVTSSGTWDINNSANLVWTNGFAATYYQEPAGTGVTGDRVLFDDTTLTANSTVTLNTYVSPTTMTVSNQLYSYTFSGIGAIAGTNSLTKQGTNVLTLANANIIGGSVTLSSGSLILDSTNTVNGSVTVNGGAAGALLAINGSMTLAGAASDLTLGAAGNDRSVMKQNGTLTIGRNFNLGNASAAVGACYQTGGFTTVTNYLGVGSVAGGYGYYRLSNGTLNVRTYFELATYGSGVVDLFDGILSTENNFDLARRSGGVGVLNVFGGTAKAPSNGNPIQMGRNDYAGPVARLTIMGSGVVDAANGSGTTKILDMNAGNGNGGTTVLNLLTGGTLIANKVSATRVGTTVFNFDGGTLKASPLTTVGATFLTGLDSAIVYPGGALIDTANASITIAQSLLAPTDYGISAISLASNGAGYIGAPVVNITGGSGKGLTAIASVDLTDGSPTKGKLTGITITSKGTGYKNTDVPTVALSGGGFTTAAVIGGYSFAANTSGGLTKIGLGALTLSGVNTYSGATLVNNGELLGLPGGSCANSAVTVQPSGSGATATLAVRNSAVNEQWTCNSLTTSAGMNGATANPILEFDFATLPSATVPPLVVTGTAAFSVTPDVSVSLVNLTVPAGTYPLMVVGGTAPTELPTLTITGGYSGSSLSWSGNTLMLTIAGTATPITWNSGATGSGLWNLNNSANLVWKTGAGASTYYQEPTGMSGDQVLFDDTFITANTTVTLNAPVIPASVTANNSSYAYTLSGSAITGTTRLMKSGSAPLTLSSANTYSGGTTIAGGSTLNLGNAASLGTGGVTNDGILNVTGGNEVTITGLSTSLSGSGTNNVTLGTGTQTTFMNGNHTGFTGLWNIGVGAGAGAGRAQMNGNAQGVDNSAATINMLPNATLWISTVGMHYATAVLNGGNTGESYGQLRLDSCEWAGPVILAGLITDVNDAFLGSESANSKISGTISEIGGPYEVTKLGSKILTLTGNNTFRGPVWVKNGAISVPVIKNLGDDAGPLGAPTTTDQAKIKLGYGGNVGNLTYTGAGETINRIIDMAGTTGGATLDHSGTNLLKFTSDLLISGVGAKQLRLQGSTVSTGEVAGVISDSSSGAVNLYKEGINSTWILSNTNLFTGGVNINAGKLIITKSTALGVGTKTVTMTAGSAGHCQLFLDGSEAPIVVEANVSYQISNTADLGSIYNIAGTNTIKGNITITAGGGGLSFYSYADKLTYSGTITASAADRGVNLRGDGDGEITGIIVNGSSPTMFLSKELGAGTWTLSGANTYTGITTVNSGTLLVNGSTAAGSAVTVNTGGTLGGTGTVNGTVFVALGGILTAGGINATGTLTLAKNSATSLTLNGGTLLVDLPSAGTACDKINIRGASGKLVLNGANTVALSFPYGPAPEGVYTLMTCSGGITLNAGASLDLQGSYPNASLSVVGNDVILTVGVGGTSGMTWTGIASSVWDGGELNWTNGSAAVAFAPGQNVVFDDTALGFAVSSGSPVSPASVLFNNSVNDYTVSAAMAGTIPVMKLGAGALTLSGTNTYTGPTSIGGGTLTIGGAGLLGNGLYATNIFNNGGGAFTYASSAAQTLSGILSGPGTLVKAGTGTLTLAGANTYSDSTTVNEGVLKIQNGNALGAVAVGTSVAMGGTLELAGDISVPAEPLNLYGTLASQTGSNTYTGVVSLRTGSSIDVGLGSILILTASTPDLGALPFSKTGDGTLRLTADPNHRGICTIAGGTLELASGGSTDANFIIDPGATLRLVSGTPLGDYRLQDDGTFDLRTSDGTGALDGSGVVTIGNTGSYTLTIGGANQSGSFSGVLQNGTGMLGFTKAGTGTQILTGVNTYTNTTTVSGGTLLINSPGSLSTYSAVTVNNGCALGGSGTINGTVNMAAGSILAPGDTNSCDTLTLAKNSATSLTLNGNTLRFDISDVPGVYDRIAVTGASGNLVLNGVNSVELNFTAGSIPAGTYTLMTFASKSGSGVFALAQGYPNATLTSDSTSLTLTVGAGGTTYGLTWKGSASSSWDGTYLNWVVQGIATNFVNGDGVTFNDSASRFTVGSGIPVSPASVAFSNSVNAYIVSADIDGAGTLVKNGTSTATLSGLTTYNPSSFAINAGSLVLGGTSRLNSGLYETNIFNIGTLSYASSATQTLSGAISGPGALIKSGSGSLTLVGATNTIGAVTVSGSGTLTLAGTTNNIDTTIVNSGLLNVNGPTSLGAKNMTVGNANSDRGSVIFSANAAMNKLYVGNASSFGAVIQNSGMLSVGPTTGGDDVFSLGLGGGYGYYQMNGGSLTVGQLGLPGKTGATSANNAVLDLFNGVIDITAANGWLVLGWSSGNGVLNLFNGSLLTPASGNDAGMAFGANGNSFGMINLLGSGARLDATAKGTVRAINLALAAGNKASVINLNAGVCIANRIGVSVATTPTYVNFNGGTLRANVAAANFLQGLTATTIYPGGAVIDSTNVSITVVQPLLAPTDSGVVSVDLTSGGADYIGAPVVMISGGSGTNATAIARVDLNPASEFFGQVTSIEVTSPGVRYQPGDVLTVTCLGGGCATPASATATVGANSSSGGLTKLGSGTLTLSGANTYGGATTISSGTLKLGIANALPTNSVVNVNGGIYDLGGFTVTNGAVNVTSGSIVNGRINSSDITKDGEELLNFSVLQTAPAPVIINGGTLKLNNLAGLYEGRVSGAFELGLSNPQTAVKLCPTNAYMFFNPSTASGGIWVDNSTYIYTGVIWNRSPTNETWTFCKSFDDSVQIKVDGISVLNVNGNWDVVVTANYVVTPGPHAFEVRLGQGSGGVGQATNKTVPGAGFDRQGRSNSAFCVPIIDPGDGSLLTLFGSNLLSTASTVELAANTLLDLGGTAQTLAGLSGSGTVSNGTLTVTGVVSPAGTNAIGTLTAKANTTLSGKLLVNVATDGTSDVLDVQGNLTLLSPTLEIADLQGLSTLKIYTLVNYSGSISGSFTPTNLPHPLWAPRTVGNKIQLYYRGGTMVRIM